MVGAYELSLIAKYFGPASPSSALLLRAGAMAAHKSLGAVLRAPAASVPASDADLITRFFAERPAEGAGGGAANPNSAAPK